ncbi:Transmembrane domain-containing protein [Spironucleus salmonicida]|uniref:Transmembrane domain-containing protein n=1 Tax=Spironucleus salmonicida TaxID=348837 RepID=V6LXE1_9EUKA|nr:Transmembrane domain-containing protein [Spironucleus salmonicida]|eukprot:EST45489.1 Transmembrane domain-containing protein [Spironucleus salmonicida]
MKQRNYIEGMFATTNLWAITVQIYEMFCVKVISPPRYDKDNDFSQQSFLFSFFHCGRFAEETFVFLQLLTVQFSISQRCSSISDIIVQAGKHLIQICIPVWSTAFLVHQNASSKAFIHNILFISAFKQQNFNPLDILQIHSQLVIGIIFIVFCNCISLGLKINLQKIASFSFNFCVFSRLVCSVLVVFLTKNAHILFFPFFQIYLYAIAIYVSTVFWRFEVNEFGITNTQIQHIPPTYHLLVKFLCSKSNLVGDMLITILTAFGSGFLVKFVHQTESDFLSNKLMGIFVLAFGRVGWILVFYMSIVPVFYDFAPLTNRFLACPIFTSLGVHANENFIGAIVVLQTLLQATKGMQVGPYNNGTVLLAVGGVMSLTLVGGQLIAQLFSLIVKAIVSKIDRYWELQKTKRVAMQIRQKMVNK